MTLRRRLVLVLVGLAALGVGVAMSGVFGAVQDWRGGRNDQALERAARAMAGPLDAGVELDPGTDRTDPVQGAWRAVAADGDFPSFFRVHDPEGRTLGTDRYGGRRPDLDARLTADRRPGPTPRAAVVHRAPSADSTDGDGDPQWLLRTSRLADGRLLTVGMQTGDYDELTRRSLLSAAAITPVVLLGVALLARRAVRRGLAPLEAIAGAAAAIGGGELSRRVEPATSRTEVGRLGLALNAMLGQIETAFAERRASEERLRRFVGNASHELRTPVATIRGYAELFRRGAAERPGDLAKAMRRIESEAARMGGLVDELLLLARLDEGRPLERVPVDLAALAADAVADGRATGPERSLVLEADGPVPATGDPERLRQVLGNLLANVQRHTPVEAGAVVRVSAADGWALLEVADSGPGLAEEELARIFERFYRARGAAPGGSGLGLAIVRAVAEAHDGTAGAARTPGGGLTVWFRLPSATPTAATRPPRPPPCGGRS